jgi:hypothetical protein
MIRVVGFQVIQASRGQVVQVQTHVGFGHHRQAVADGRRFLEVFYHVAATVGSCDVTEREAQEIIKAGAAWIDSALEHLREAA